MGRVVYDPMMQPPVTVATVSYGVITLLIFGAILSYATSVGSILADIFDFRQIGKIVQLVALLIVIVWAYRVFFWLPYFSANPGQYDLLFLILGIGVMGWLGFVLYANVDEVSEFFTKKVVTGELWDEPLHQTGVTDSGSSTRHAGDQTGESDDLWMGENEAEPSGVERTDESETAQSDLSDPDGEADSSQVDSEEDRDQHSENSCLECGISLAEEAQFCHACGATIE
jgi:hypothetical protein